DQATVGRPQALENFDSAGFSGSVGAEQPENFALFDRKTDAAEGLHSAIALRQVMDIDDWDGHSKSLSIAHSGAQANSVPARSERERNILMRRDRREAVRKACLSPPG